MKVFLLCFLMAITGFLCEDNSAFEWTDPSSGTKYDFSSLKRNADQNVAVSEVLEVLKQPTDTCEILGRAEVKTVGLLDNNNPKKGIYIQYGGGDKCTNGDNPMQNGKPRQTKFNIYCAEKQDEFRVDLPGGTQGTTKCTLEFKINSPAGCPGGSFGYTKSTSILISIIVLFSLYFAAGTFYNIKQNNLSGKEAIPNIEFWRTFPSLVQDGMAYSLSAFKQLVAFIKRKVSGNNQAYNDL